jgi:dolichyl-phosphate-mannose-protein mannosyltransferase
VPNVSWFMNLYSKPDYRSALWFWSGIAAIFLASLALRFWGLHRINTLVFDEVYYAKFAVAFLQGKQDFGGHPPLSTYLIAAGIWISERLNWGNLADTNSLAGMTLRTFSYRWLNALTGAFIPLVMAAIAYQLTHRRRYALLAGLFTAVDGLILVESRYALNNVYLILFGLLGQLGFLIALNVSAQARWFWLAIAGVGFGASFSIKWNGLGFLLGAYLIWIAAWMLRGISAVRPLATPSSSVVRFRSPLANLTRLHLGHSVFGLAIVPAITYYISWIPYMQLDPSTSFLGWQAKIMEYHKQVGGMNVHPYCSPWYSWPFMVRPVAYFYKTAVSVNEPIPVGDAKLPQEVARIVYDVHAMGNPFLWWFSSIAMVLLLGVLIHQGWVWLQTVQSPVSSAEQPMKVSISPLYAWAALYLVLNWMANLLPWLEVSRCTFLYHYMTSLMFAILAIALIVDRWLQSSQDWRRAAGLTIIFIILAAFIFWLPLYLALPLAPDAFRLRQWFPSWV